ncbi:MAG: hypothetical protein F6J87_16395 [Spirulina sp. SIO3F2]|nr:hypothetical protein [Spirulina sp. SIO3F2]
MSLVTTQEAIEKMIPVIKGFAFHIPLALSYGITAISKFSFVVPLAVWSLIGTVFLFAEGSFEQALSYPLKGIPIGIALGWGVRRFSNRH